MGLTCLSCFSPSPPVRGILSCGRLGHSGECVPCTAAAVGTAGDGLGEHSLRVGTMNIKLGWAHEAQGGWGQRSSGGDPVSSRLWDTS